MKTRTTVISTIVFIATAAALANVENYRVPLQHMKGEVVVMEKKDGTLLEMRSRLGSLEVHTDGAGKATEYSVVLGSMIYWDLDGDGTLEARYNKTASQADIWIGNSWVQVRDSKDGFRSRRKRSSDGTIEYEFKEGCWTRQAGAP